MKNLFFIFIIFLSVILMSYHSKEQMSCEELKAENRMLRDSIASLQKFSSNKPEAIVEIENMNVVYRGANNPVKIAVPNSLRFSVMAPGLKYVGENRYELRPTTGKEVTFRIVADMRNGETLKFEKVFRIEDIGSGKIAVNNIKYEDDFIKLTKSEIKKTNFSLYVYNYLPFPLQKTLGFTVLFPKRENITVNGNTFSEEAQRTLDLMSSGDTIYITRVKVTRLDNTRICKITPLAIEIID